MNDQITNETERAHRSFWIVDPGSDMPVQREGYECKGNDYWWFPRVGYSISAAKCHETAASAAAEAIAELEHERDEVEGKLIILRERY